MVDNIYRILDNLIILLLNVNINTIHPKNKAVIITVVLHSLGSRNMKHVQAVLVVRLHHQMRVMRA